MSTESKIVIGADVSAVTAGFKRAEQDAERLTGKLGRLNREGFKGLEQGAGAAVSRIEQLSSVVSRVAAFGGVLVGLGAGVAALRNVANGLDALNDAADATGSSVAALGGLEEVGRRTGTSFDTITGVLVKFNAQLDAAKDPSSSAAQALASIGLEAEQLRRLDPAQALEKVALALAAFADNGDKARLVQELFGKSARVAAPFLKDLAEFGLQNAEGLQAQAEAAEQFNRQLSAMGAEASALSRDLVGNLIPALTETLRAMREQGVGKTILDGFSVKLNEGLAEIQNAKLADRIAELDKLLQVPEADRGIYRKYAIGELRKEIDELSQSAAKANDRVKALIGAPDKPTLTAKQAEKGRDGYGPAYVEPVTKTGGGGRASTGAREKPQFVGVSDSDIVAERRRRFGELQRELQQLDQERQRQFQQADQFGEQLRQQTADLNASLIRDERARGQAFLEIDRQQMQERLDQLQVGEARRRELQKDLDKNIAARQAQLTEQLKPEWQRMLEGWQDTNALMGKAHDDMMAGVLARSQDVIADFVRTGKLSMDSLADYVQQTIARLIAQKATAALASLAGDYISLMTTGFAKGGVFGAGGQITAFASGGIVDRPTLFSYGNARTGLMGEAGPEAIVPLKRGRDGKLGIQSAGPSGPSVQINIAAGVTRQELAGIVPQLRESIRSELITSMRRPGWQGG